MELSEETLSRAGQAILDLSSGSTFAERMSVVAEVAQGLLGEVQVASFTYDKANLFPDRSPKLGKLDFREERLWCSDPSTAQVLLSDYPYYVSQDPVPRVAGQETHKAHVFSFDWSGKTEIEADFYPRMRCAHDLVAGLDTFAEQGLALVIMRDQHQRRYSRRERALTELLYDPVVVAMRELLLVEQLSVLGQAAGEGSARTGAVIFSARGEIERWDPRGQALLAAVDLDPARFASWLTQQVQLTATALLSRAAPERVFFLPAKGGGKLEVRLAALRVESSRVGVVSLLRRCQEGSADYFAAAASSAGLTPREREVAELVLLGLSNNEAARELGIRAQTVRVHLTRVYRKVGVADRQGLRLRLLGL